MDGSRVLVGTLLKSLRHSIRHYLAKLHWNSITELPHLFPAGTR